MKTAKDVKLNYSLIFVWRQFKEHFYQSSGYNINTKFKI